MPAKIEYGQVNGAGDSDQLKIQRDFLIKKIRLLSINI